MTSSTKKVTAVKKIVSNSPVSKNAEADKANSVQNTLVSSKSTTPVTSKKSAVATQTTPTANKKPVVANKVSSVIAKKVETVTTTAKKPATVKKTEQVKKPVVKETVVKAKKMVKSIKKSEHIADKINFYSNQRVWPD
jgi:lactam utilization protein B